MINFKSLSFIIVASFTLVTCIKTASNTNQLLHDQIKSDIYKTFFQEMGIIRKDWQTLASENPQLQTDLKELYKAFMLANQDKSQEVLDAFCIRWHLNNIKISDC